MPAYDVRQLNILKRVKLMLIAKMEKLVTAMDAGDGAVSESVDEISESIVKVEQQI